MAISFKESPWYIQALVFVALAILLMAAGEYVPGLPVAKARQDLQQVREQDTKLNQEVSALQVYERRYSEFQVEMAALNKQLDTLKTIVPEEKEVDEFIRQVQGAAASSNVQLRKLTSQPIVPKEYHYEMPFEVQADGPYFNMLDFFSRLSRLSRIINVGDLQFDDPATGKGTKYPIRPGTTVTGVFTVTTFFTKPADLTPAGGAKGAGQPVKKP